MGKKFLSSDGQQSLCIYTFIGGSKSGIRSLPYFLEYKSMIKHGCQVLSKLLIGSFFNDLLRKKCLTNSNQISGVILNC